MLRDPNAYNDVPSRQRVLEQALALEEDIGNLNKVLTDVTKQVSSTQASANKASEVYLLGEVADSAKVD